MADFIIALADLAEAEGRALRRNIVGLWQRLALLVLTVLLAAGGAGLVLWALFLSLGARLGSAAAALLTGGVALLAAGGLAWLVNRITR